MRYRSRLGFFRNYWSSSLFIFFSLTWTVIKNYKIKKGLQDVAQKSEYPNKFLWLLML